MIDLHIHTAFSQDSNLSPIKACEVAIERGIKVICFVEHIELNSEDPGYMYFNYGSFSETVNKLNQKYKGKLLILKGAEVTYQSLYEMDIFAYLRDKKFDLLMGSIHYVENIPIEKWMEKEESPYNFLPYFREIRDMCKSRLFHIVGHFDYFRKYMGRDNFTPKKYERELRLLLKYIALSGMGIEVNTQGMRQFHNLPFPSWELLKMYKEEGGEKIIVGSDAHEAFEIGYGIKEVLKKVKEIGFDSVFLIRGGNPRKIPIDKLI